jgi:nucleoside recognition membrane protein YjiH
MPLRSITFWNQVLAEGARMESPSFVQDVLSVEYTISRAVVMLEILAMKTSLLSSSSSSLGVERI